MSVKKNIVANFLGKGWAAMLGLLLVPFYLKFLGIKAYGILGFFTSISAFISLLDIGLSATFSLQIAKLLANNDMEKGRHLLRTLEVVMWSFALVIMLSFFILSPFLANHWFYENAELNLKTNFYLMGIVIGLQFPFALYSSGLIGIQKQVILNVTSSAIGTLRFGGVLLLLWLVSPTLQAFFAWQIVVFALQTLFAAKFLWRFLPGPKSFFSFSILKEVAPFTLKMSGLIVTGLILTQTDKIILSKLLPLEQFGYYSLAATASGGLFFLITPIFQAFLPRLTELENKGDFLKLKESYHSGAQLMSVTLLPVFFLALFFTPSILWFWTKDSGAVENASLITTLLFLGTTLNGLFNFPLLLQLAKNCTSLILYQNIISIVLMIPAVIIGNKLLGPVAGAIVWVVLNLSFLLISVPLMHKRLLKGELQEFYIQDTLLPLIGAAIPVIVCYFYLSDLKELSFIGWGFRMFCIWLMSLGGAFLFSTRIRKNAKYLFRQKIKVLKFF
jgi:O-antigen/teichoic acid export membrane protein